MEPSSVPEGHGLLHAVALQVQYTHTYTHTYMRVKIDPPLPVRPP